MTDQALSVPMDMRNHDDQVRFLKSWRDLWHKEGHHGRAMMLDGVIDDLSELQRRREADKYGPMEG